jgi:hypothetical protein
MQENENLFYPYPLRPSEFARNLDVSGVKPIELTPEEREEIKKFEEPLAAELKPLRLSSPGNCVIYPSAFSTPEGNRVFAATFLNENIATEVKGKTDAEVDKYFDSLVDATSSEENFEEYRNSRSFARPGELDETQVKELFAQVDLAKIPLRIRSRLEKYSSQYAEDRFSEAFRKSGGEVERIKDPERIGRIVRPEVLDQQIRGHRKFKQSLKDLIRGLGDSNLDHAKREVIKLYQIYNNFLLADTYGDKRLEDKSVTPRMMERIDHFLNGVGEGHRKDLLHPTVPLRLARFSMKRVRGAGKENTEIYDKYNQIKLDASDAETISNLILKLNGITGWNVVIDPTKRNLSVIELNGEGEEVKRININSNFDRGLIDALSTLGHEIEGHVLRFVNRKNAMDSSLKILNEMGTGRSAILSEASALKVEDLTASKIADVTLTALPYHYLALKRKSEGASFKSIYLSVMELRARRIYDMSLSELLKDEKKFKEAHGKSYKVALRVFRGHTPLNDRSGYISNSDELNYIESELLANFLEKADSNVRKVLYVQGISLYSLESLIKLGVLDTSKVQEPSLAAVNILWPQIKNGLDNGKGLKDILEELKSSQ